MYSRSLFELKYPEVKVEFVDFNQYSDPSGKTILTRLAGGNAPSIWAFWGDPVSWARKGLCADVTDLWKKSDVASELAKRGTTVLGCYDDYIHIKDHYYGAPYNMGFIANGVMYRKDWCKEAGIFNEIGEPGPNLKWTMWDFREIAKRLPIQRKNAGDMGTLLKSMDPLKIYFAGDKFSLLLIYLE